MSFHFSLGRILKGACAGALGGLFLGAVLGSYLGRQALTGFVVGAVVAALPPSFVATRLGAVLVGAALGALVLPVFHLGAGGTGASVSVALYMVGGCVTGGLAGWVLQREFRRISAAREEQDDGTRLR